jgi:hypothetical protein
MNPQKAKIFLINNGLTVAEIARRVAPYTGAKEKSVRVMLTDMINGRRYYPSLADKVEELLGLRLERPSWFEPISRRGTPEA